MLLSWAACACLATVDLRAADEPAAAATATEQAAESSGQKYLLRYKFEAGETIRWEVVHQAQIRTTVSGTTQTAETLSKSIKVWQVASVDDQGQAVFVHSVESVDMRQKLTGRQEARFNSLTDSRPPEGFADVADAVGVPLATITLDALGNVVRREHQRPKTSASAGMITIPLPDEPVAVGHEWLLPSDVQVSLKQGGFKKIKTRQRFTLVEIQDGLATIRIETQVLSPVRDPNIEAQLIQTESNGTARFDISAGRIVSQQTDVDKRVHGAPNEASSLHCLTRFTEKLLPAASQAAGGEQPAGPEPPPTASSRRPSVR
ncbi:MAG: hypothetical protein WD403_02585 [Pirellulales bacterium]